MAKGKGKVKIPKSVLELRRSPEKFAKKHGIRIKKTKHMSKKELKRNRKKLRIEYSRAAINGLNKAVKILAEYPEAKNIDKVKKGVENIITHPDVMKQIIKIYKKHPDDYGNLMYLPRIITNTLLYYSSEDISEDEKEAAKDLDKEELTKFCEKILKKQVKRYRNMGLSDMAAFQIAVVAPTTAIFKKSRYWYKSLIQDMYDIAGYEDVDIDEILNAVARIDKGKKRALTKKEFKYGFYSEFILTKNSNKVAKYNETQRDLHEGLIERCLTYMDKLKSKKLREMLRTYIKRRKTAESYKNDSKRIIRFTDHANSNSSYTNIKTQVQELIDDNSSNELYLD